MAGHSVDIPLLLALPGTKLETYRCLSHYVTYPTLPYPISSKPLSWSPLHTHYYQAVNKSSIPLRIPSSTHSLTPTLSLSSTIGATSVLVPSPFVMGVTGVGAHLLWQIWTAVIHSHSNIIQPSISLCSKTCVVFGILQYHLSCHATLIPSITPTPTPSESSLKPMLSLSYPTPSSTGRQ